MTTENDSKKPEPTFDKQTEYSLGNQDTTDPIFSKAYHTFMRDILKERDNKVREELKKSVAEVINPWHTKLDLIISNQADQSSDLDYLKTMAKENRGRIEALENVVDVHNRILEGHNAILRNMKPNKLMQIVVWVTLAISFITAIALLFHII